MSPRKAFARSGHGLVLLPLAASVLVAILVAACGSEAATNSMPPPPSVSVATVLTKNVHEWDEFTGRVSAVETVELRPRVSGYVERVAFHEGQEVHKGDLLFQIDQRRYQAALDEALAALARARSEAHLAHTHVATTT